MEVFAGFLAHTDHRDRPAAAMPSGATGWRQHAGLLRRRRQRPERRRQAWTARTNEMMAQNGVGGDPSLRSCTHRRARRPETYDNHYAVGLGLGDVDAVPVDEAGRLAFRRHAQRPGRLWPGHISRQGRAAIQFRHVIDVAPTILEAAGIAVPDDGQRRRADADRGRQHVPTRSPTPKAPEHTSHPIFRNLRQPRDLPGRLGRRTPSTAFPG